MSRISELIRTAKQLDPKLGAELDDEVRHLQERRAFGLNFERHQPEAVDLYGRPVRLGDKVRMLAPRTGHTAAPDDWLWVVTGGGTVDGVDVAELAEAKTRGPDVPPRTATYPVADLVVVAENTDVIYPGLVSTGKVERGGDTPFHTVINGENLHALKALLYTHRGKVDAIYIDPPYNTGNDDWIYNDKYVSGDDLYRHSKWLAFMERRLVLARELLKETGVIIVAIGDEEHHRLRMLMDQVFDAANFISDVVWQGARKNDSRYVSNSADYMLIYARNEARMSELGIRWRDRKDGIDDVFAAGADAWKESGHDAVKATELLRAWFRTQRGRFTASITNYQKIDDEGRIYYGSDLRSPNPRPNLQYDVPHPVTGKPCRRHPNGWAVSPSVMQERIAEGRILFGPDHTTLPYYKRYLSEQANEVAFSTFEYPRRTAGERLVTILGESRFPNPKDHNVIARWLKMACGPDATVLDFFGGSGSTMEAVMRLNAQDDGTRQCILVTNNEVGSQKATELRKKGLRPGDPDWERWGVHDYVTTPRITAVVTGERPDGSQFEDTVAANAEFFTLTYEAPLDVAADLEFARIAPLLWLRAGARGRRIEALTEGWAVAEAYGVIQRMEHFDRFLTALAEQPGAKLAFLITDDERRFQSACALLPDGVEGVRLYESYLRNFQIDAARSSR